MKRNRGVGRPPEGECAKKMISMRVDPKLHEAMKSLGKGWQSKVEHFLKRKFMKED